jgi:Domain of unknown function (DUF5076)
VVELEVPKQNKRERGSKEILRVWRSAQGDQGFVISTPREWNDHAGWGLLFADLARFVASHGATPEMQEKILTRIVEGFTTELPSGASRANG